MDLRLNLLTYYPGLGKLFSSNLNSIFVLEVHPDTNQFHRLFIAYACCIEGFKFCLPVLYVDGTFGKSPYKGTILCATGRTGNKGKLLSFIFLFLGYVLFVCVCLESVERHAPVSGAAARCNHLLPPVDVLLPPSMLTFSSLFFVVFFSSQVAFLWPCVYVILRLKIIGVFSSGT